LKQKNDQFQKPLDQADRIQQLRVTQTWRDFTFEDLGYATVKGKGEMRTFFLSHDDQEEKQDYDIETKE